MRFVTSLAAAAVVLASSVPAFAHGGQYRGPGGRTPPDPTAPIGGPTSTSDWEAWWSANSWKYVNLRERVRDRDDGNSDRSGGTLGSTPGAPEEAPRGADPIERRKLFEREVLPVVTGLLFDSDAEVRSAAAVALGKMGYPRSILDLRKALKDDARDVRDGAILALGMIQDGIAAEVLQPLLLDPKEPDRTRAFAAVGLGLIGGEEGAPGLLHFLDPASDADRTGGMSRTAHTEAGAITGLGLSRYPAAAPVLRRDYASATRYQPAVRAFLAIALARLGDRESIPFLLQGLEHEREPMRQSAAIALGVLGRPEDEVVVKTLAMKSLTDKDVNTRQFCVMALARIGGPAAREAVRRVLERGSRIDQPLAAIGAALGHDEDALPILRKAWQEEKQPSVKGGYALALGLIHDRESAESIRVMAFGKVDRGLRGTCLLALGLLDDKESAKGAREMVETENDPGLRMAAATCLGLLRDPGTVPVLEKLAREGDNVYIRTSACRLLGDVGNPLSARLLSKIATDAKDNSVVRMTATAALGNLADRNLVPILSSVGIDANYVSVVDPLIEIASLM